MYGEGGRWLHGQRLGPAAQGGLPGLSKKPSTVLAAAAFAAMRESSYSISPASCSTYGRAPSSAGPLRRR
jgi:hypothetical protein